MRDQQFLKGKLRELTAFIEAEDKAEYSELLRAREREDENTRIREKENEELFKQIGVANTSQAFKKGADRARKRTDNTLAQIREGLINVPDPRSDDGKVISQIQSIAKLGKSCPQSALFHANVSKFGVGESDGIEELRRGSIDAWCWARGGGLWNSADISVNADFWFLHYPDSYQLLRIVPYVVLHGFYINIADDEWWNSAYSRTRVDVRIRSYQYYWSGWSSYNVHNRGDDNINRSGRIDRSGHYSHRMWVAAEDPVWTLVRARLYAYARASGSYSEVNFAAGAGNYTDVPHVHFF